MLAHACRLVALLCVVAFPPPTRPASLSYFCRLLIAASTLGRFEKGCRSINSGQIVGPSSKIEGMNASNV